MQSRLRSAAVPTVDHPSGFGRNAGAVLLLDQLQQVKKLGPLDKIMEMLPGMNQLTKNQDIQIDEKEIAHVEAIIRSMTRAERRDPNLINGSRRKRIAAGSGTRVQDVNKLLKQFVEARKMMKRFKDMQKMGKNKLSSMFKMPFMK